MYLAIINITEVIEKTKETLTEEFELLEDAIDYIKSECDSIENSESESAYRTTEAAIYSFVRKVSFCRNDEYIIMYEYKDWVDEFLRGEQD